MFIKEDSEFETALNLVKGILADGSEFPEQIFQKQFKQFSFEVFYRKCNADFWSKLQELAELSNDEVLLIIPINSFEENNFKKRYGVFNWMKISIINTYDQYMDLMNLCPRSGEETYSTLVCVDEIIWLPTSCKWVMYGSRDYDLCMLATQESMPKYIALNPVEWVIKEGMVNAFRHQIIPENIVKSIIKNYSNK